MITIKVGDKVKPDYPFYIKDLLVDKDEVFGTVFYLDKEKLDCLVQLLPKFNGWSADHCDYEMYHCTPNHTYWWTNPAHLYATTNLMKTE